MIRRRYSDVDRAGALAALDANAGDVSKTARDTGIPRQTIQEWQAGNVPNTVPELRQGKKIDLAERFENLAEKMVGVADKGADKLNAKDATIAAGVAVDKMRLLRGQTTATGAIVILRLAGVSLEDL